MRRKTGPPTTFLAAAALLAACAGCSANYTGERLYWSAEQLHSRMQKHPEQVTAAQVEAVAAAYARVIRAVPGRSWAGKAQLALGLLYAGQQQHDRALEALRTVLVEYSRHSALCLNARFGIAKIHEARQEWDQAIAMYRELSEFHPWSAIGMEAPLAIARSYEQRGLTAEAMDAYQRAVGTYSTRIAEGPSAELVTRAKGYLALVHQRLGHWDRAIDLLEELAGSEGVNRPLVLLSLATIYQTKTGNAEKAGAVYGRLSQEFPEHVFGQVAKKQLERLQQPDMPEALSAPVTP